MNKGFGAVLATVSVLALAAPAFAQEQAAADQTSQPGATVSNTTAATADPAAIGPDESDNGDIIVTATRRASRIQDVPLAVNALSGDQLVQSGFQSVQDIQYQIPGVQFGTSPNDAGFRLRGVGSAGGFSSSSEQNVGTVVDNVVIPFGNPVQSLGDLDRIEVLKGPQGTQFGKNASSGVVNITTRKPDATRFGGSAFASYAELNERNLNASLNIPITSTLAAAVYGFDREFDGYVRNIVRDEDWGGIHAYGGRAKLFWEPSADFSAYLIGDWSRSKSRGPGGLWTLNRAPVSASPLTNARFAAVRALGVTPSFTNSVSVEDGEGFGDERNWGGSLELNGKLGDYNLTSVTAYRRYDLRPFRYSIDALPFPIFTARESGNDRSFVSQEVRLTSPTGATFEYVAGVYLSQLKAGIGGYFASAQLRPAVPFAPQPQISITGGRNTSTTTTKSAAGFVDGSVRLAPSFRVLFGGRYSYDWVDAANFATADPLYPSGQVGPNGFTVPYAVRSRVTGSTDRGDWSGRLGFEATPADDILFFGTVARGYLGPTVTFSGLTGQQVTVDPQTVWDVTLGAKTQFFDRKLTLNGNIFFDTYKDLQTSVFNGLVIPDRECRRVRGGGVRTGGDVPAQSALLGQCRLHLFAHLFHRLRHRLSGFDARAGGRGDRGTVQRTRIDRDHPAVPGAGRGTVRRAQAYRHRRHRLQPADRRATDPRCVGDLLLSQQGAVRPGRGLCPPARLRSGRPEHRHRGTRWRVADRRVRAQPVRHPVPGVGHRPAVQRSGRDRELEYARRPAHDRRPARGPVLGQAAGGRVA